MLWHGNWHKAKDKQSIYWSGKCRYLFNRTNISLNPENFMEVKRAVTGS
jgi:hypothetical protein